ncbi:MAG TPA: glycosyltransferase family A protein [Candidatus Marinimicrobia bacterium]|nr:glycosyltransferase family A protein [Candidatus Neomarinimicrobiota bacterium]MDP7217282.1 glycosyltransferase family A protein [Candidatus Neomarinimicrobiota bacterium]MDP7436798.1 glycosyltransferase family A protein [Candidatus Neomarinimicrobiota bacterium]HJL74527.1 glycosyltransferase family A protein [Candidatus Neomarinimicrobiota bacterium]HJM70082.1 glycosyltransferase family A protein [Candidatus Neomarinimicrobiota bacterium]
MTPKSQPDISVIIPTFNRAHTLPRALDSVMVQTLQSMEIIIVDDGSTDETNAVLADYPGLCIISQDNRGVSAARNVGIEKAGGEWLAFLDSDDEWLKEKLEKQWDAICNDDKLICHTEEIWIRNGQRVNPMKKHQKYGGLIYEKCLPLCVISPSSVMIHKTVFNDVGNFDETLEVCEDYDLWLRICSKYPVLFVDEPLIVKYGGHDDQLSRKHWGMDRFRAKALEKMIASGASNDEDEKATVNMLIQKCEIIINGMKKRGKDVEAMEWEEKLKKYKK